MIQMFYQLEPVLERSHLVVIADGCARCDCCGEIVAEDKTVILDDTVVCEDCLADFCKSYVEDFADEYIAAHRKEFCLEWILPSYSEEDIIRAVLADYEQNKEREIELGGYSAEYIKKNEQQFCLESSDWQDFVRESL